MVPIKTVLCFGEKIYAIFQNLRVVGKSDFYILYFSMVNPELQTIGYLEEAAENVYCLKRCLLHL